MGESRTTRVLVVDDEPTIREMLVHSLKSDGIEVASASRASEAIRLASFSRPDIIVTDIFLGDSSGFDLLDTFSDIPAVVITGSGDAEVLSEASRRQPLELMTKPLNLRRLRAAVFDEIGRLEQDSGRESVEIGAMRKHCAGLMRNYRNLSNKLLAGRTLIHYQQKLISAKKDDDIFRAFYYTFVRKCGPVYGISMLCNSEALLSVTGRFGVPEPDSIGFCRHLASPVTEMLLEKPDVQVIDALEIADKFDESMRRYLPGMTILAIPLIPARGELIGTIILYRKGEQPFDRQDCQLARNLAFPTALAIRAND